MKKILFIFLILLCSISFSQITQKKRFGKFKSADSAMTDININNLMFYLKDYFEPIPIIYAWETELDFGIIDNNPVDTSLSLMITNMGYKNLTVNAPTGLNSPYSDTITVSFGVPARDSIEVDCFLDRNMPEETYNDTWNFTSDGGNLTVNVTAFIDTHYVPSFSPPDLDSLITWLNPTTIWSATAWGDTSGAPTTITPDPLLTLGNNTILGTASTLKDNPHFIHTNNGASSYMWSVSQYILSYGEFNNWTVFFVDSILSTTANYEGLTGVDGGSADNEIVFMRVDNSTPKKLNLITRDAAAVIGCNFLSDSTVSGKWGIHVFQWSSDNLTGRIVVSGDTTSTTANNAFDKSTIWTGWWELDFFSIAFPGATVIDAGIAEIIAYRGYKTLSEITQIANYLSTKYGLFWNGTYY